MGWAESPPDQSDDCLALLLTEIADDFNMPGEVTALPGGDDRHYLIFRPRNCERVSRILALAGDIAIELGADELHIEQAPIGEMLEFQFRDDRLRYWRVMLRRARQT